MIWSRNEWGPGNQTGITEMRHGCGPNIIWPMSIRFHLDPAVSVTRDYNKIWNILCSQLCSYIIMRCISTRYIKIIKKLLKRSNKVYLFQIWNRETVFVFLVHVPLPTCSVYFSSNSSYLYLSQLFNSPNQICRCETRTEAEHTKNKKSNHNKR